jgi:F-type H+-transporting ATPase subunit c
MMRKLQYFFMSMAAMLLASPAFAQGAATPENQWIPLAAGLGMGIAAGFCGIGQGIAAGGAAQGLARNPGARPGIFLFLILGLAFIESLALFTFVMILLKAK